MSCSSINNFFTRGLMVAVFSLVALLSAPMPAFAQSHCTEWTDRLLDTSNNCTNEPWRDRASETATFTWKGHEYLIFNGGNELFLYQIDDAANPVKVDESEFNFGNRGDSDYDLIRFHIADESRYLVLAHKMARTAVVDLGVGSTPNFSSWTTYDASDRYIGGAVFTQGGTNYLFAAGLDGDCEYGSSLYLVNDDDSLHLIEQEPGQPCMELGGSPVVVDALTPYYDEDSATLYLYAFIGATNQIYRVAGSGVDLELAERWQAPAAMASYRYLSIDIHNARAASVDYGGGLIGLWDLTVPSAPEHLYDVSANVLSVALRSPSEGSSSTLTALLDGFARSTRTWEAGPTSASEFEATYWSDPSLPHNVGPSCMRAATLALSPDGSVLYLSRNAAFDVFDLGECLVPTPARANVSITPDPVFPGQAIEVRDITTGRVDEWALWLTEEPGGAIVAGSSVLNNTNPQTINYTIPQGLQASQSYVAHVEVDSSELVPDDPYHEETVNVDRTPEASFTIEPSAVVVGDTVTLTATAEGIVGAGGYSWQITSPSNNVSARFGSVVTYTLDESGDWDFELAVGYNHEDPASPPDLYTATSSLIDYAVSSVAADFTWSPTDPIHTQEIILDASPSKPSTGLTFTWAVDDRWGGPSGYHACGSVQVCVIPADTLEPDTEYAVELTASNGTDTSVKTGYLFVRDGNIQPVITWQPTSPERGETVNFYIDGVPLEPDTASWDFGETGCDGQESTQTCIGVFSDCRAMTFTYATSGTKTVNVSFDVGDNTFSATPIQLAVQTAGSCDGGGPPGGCDYTVGRDSFEIGAKDTAAKTFTVTTTSSCAWTATASHPSWINVIAPSGQVYGTRTVRFELTENDGPERTGSIFVGTTSVRITQKAKYIEADFTMSNNRPEIGETVTFFVDPILEVESWDFGEPDCRGNDPVIDCSFLPGTACNFMEWTFTSAGEKTVTMYLRDGRNKPKSPIVRQKGQCCILDGRPEASFEMSADEIYVGETVVFSDLSSKSARTKALGFTWDPPNPEIGEPVTFTISGATGAIDTATWNFGENGCEGSPAVQTCNGVWGPCTSMSFTFASGGSKPVSVDVVIDGAAPETVGPEVVPVASIGQCDTGGGGGCSYGVSPSSVTIPAEGDTRSFNVTTTSECDWTAETSSPFITVNSGEGPGSGQVSYTVAANPAPSNRSGIITIAGEDASKNFRVSQTYDTGNTDPTEWDWLVTRIEDAEGETVDEDVYSSSEPNISFTFDKAGRYRVRLTATNCVGSDYEIDYIDVLSAPIENFVVASAISSPGANDTQWESDFRFFNPCEDDLSVSLVYQPDNEDNTAKQLSTYPFPLAPNETIVFPSVREVVDGYEGETINGSILIDSVSASGCKVLSVSRTFNQTPNGTLGLFVPAMPVTTVGVESLNLTGLIRNDDYRSNLRLVNHGEEEAWVRITVFSKNGEALTEGRSVLVKARSTRQLNDVAGWAGVETSLSQFTVFADVRTAGAIVDGFATVIDNISGDSVMNSSSYLDELKIWLPGVVYAEGRNETFWQTDLWFHNPIEEGGSLRSVATYLHGKDIDYSYEFESWPTVEAMGMRRRLDIAGGIVDDLGLEFTSGYMIFEGIDGWNAPQIAARTYTSDDNGGTYGLHLPTYGPRDLLQVGDIAYIVGISNSSDDATGFRSNLGMLATDRTANIEVTLFYPDGSQAEQTWTTKIWAGQLKQINNIFSKFGLGNADVTGTLKIEVLDGGELIIYATEIDNQTGDSIFIPTQQRYINPAQ